MYRLFDSSQATRHSMFQRDLFLAKGFFPETLPPCFDSTNLPRAFSGIIRDMQSNSLKKGRSTRYIRYVGTKHDGNRRIYATSNPVSYFSVADFIGKNSEIFRHQFAKSSLSLSSTRPGRPDEDRSVIVGSLNELSTNLSVKIKYSPYIIKTDISQFFPSIYTHIIPWIIHGQEFSKEHQNRFDDQAYFNKLDWYCQQCQNSQTRGVVVGPDAFRVIAEFIACQIDHELQTRAGQYIVGGIRHVDDFYIGVRSEVDATVVLSHLRDILQNYELQTNDSKTQVIPGLQPVDDLWAQRLRDERLWRPEDVSRLLDQAYETAVATRSASPMKLALRRLDERGIYRDDAQWRIAEPKMQRVLYHFPHCVDYVCLIIAKRHAIDKGLDRDGWETVCSLLIRRHIGFSHHHEISWLLWIMLVTGIPVVEDVTAEIQKVQNAHLNSMLIAASADGLLAKKPKISFGNKLPTTDETWLQNVVARTKGFTSASFGGNLNHEFEHLVDRRVSLIDFRKHSKMLEAANRKAISRSKYGYDSEPEPEAEDYTGLLADVF